MPRTVAPNFPSGRSAPKPYETARPHPTHMPQAPFLFLPGITGDGNFWRPVAERLTVSNAQTFVSYPGLGAQPASPTVNSASDLLALAEKQLLELDGSVVVVAQSMGGILGVQLAHRHPKRISRLVLVATSGGFDVQRHGAVDWRGDFVKRFPETPGWALGPGPDLTSALKELRIPVLLIWGDRDDISPPAAGEHLASLIQQTTMHVVPGGDHGLAGQFPDQVAALIDDFVAA